ncbi:helix-turn-helix transcriptional regulator [Affinibrenneria salicis]|uniref:Helix-turn-helix transcriptional regulator n=1 Tax=Affinibrenneria salicis TaxID=2590031 RepID=A0A5J5G6B0_9GAMM|nr:AraC family transcriptional regulator [Affinibrenneria salicis]KAA9002574.1 helix-turn-helix transcriptional regulator [Affinibrenneria salicis]KAA9003138.1 helix-turn-helix transcriptional regulator [Affinibrenneria salicis]
MRNHVPSSKSIYKNHIVQQSSLVSNNYRCQGVGLIDDMPLLFGSFNVIQLNRDLILHTADVVNLHNMKTQGLLNGAIKLAIVVNGIAHITYGDRLLHLGKAQPASLMSLTEPTLFSRNGKRDEYERTVSLTFSRDWLYGNLLDSVDDWQAIYDFTQTHLATHLWTPSRQALGIAWQILNTEACSTPLQRLYLESQCMMLIIEAFSSLTSQAQQNKEVPGVTLRNHHRVQQVRDMLESGAADQLTIAEIASNVSMSESTLQRHFRQTFNMTVFEYLRNCRLQRAMLAMQKEGIGIAQAASLAGYNSPANFATALRRVYGVTPGQVKDRF